MAEKFLSKLIISPDENTYVIYDETARSDANNALSTANDALQKANQKLSSASLQSSYENDTKTLTLQILTTTDRSGV